MPQPVNEVRLSGRLVKDVEVREFGGPKGPTRMAKFTLAFGYWKGKKMDPAWYFNCVAFGPIVNLLDTATKGTHLMITRGYLKQNVYTKKDGDKKYEHIVIVEDFVHVGAKSNTAEQMEKEIAQADDVLY